MGPGKSTTLSGLFTFADDFTVTKCHLESTSCTWNIARGLQIYYVRGDHGKADVVWEVM